MEADSLYRKHSMNVEDRGVECKVMECVKQGSLRWYGDFVIMQNGDTVKRINKTGGQRWQRDHQ